MSDATPRRFPDQYLLRLPAGMREQLKVAAERNGRSLNVEIVTRLEYSLSQTKTEIRTEMPLPEPNALQAAIQAIQFALEHQKELEEMADEKGFDVPWARTDSKGET